MADAEKDIRSRLAQIGIGDDRDFDPSALSPEIAKACQDGMADAWAEFDKFKKENIDVGKVTSGDVLGTREKIDGRWIYRMAGTVVGIYGNSREEAMYPLLTLDADGKQLDGKNNYTLTFAGGQLPPAKAFWSITMYNLPQSLLVDNPINRYLINSPMLDKLAKNDDGSLTLYIQNQSPGADRESNWLPAPAGPFWMAVRIYWPDEAALDGSWKAPHVQRVAN